MLFSKVGTHGKISASETSCSYNYATPAGNYYSALLTPAVSDNVCVVALDITVNTPSALSTAYGMVPDAANLEVPLFEQESICVECNPDGGSNIQKKYGAPWWVNLQKYGDSGLDVAGGSVKGLLLVWRKSDVPSRLHGEFAVFAPKIYRDVGIQEGLPVFRAVPAGCTRFAITSVPGATVKINQAFADKAMESLKAGDAAFAEWIKETWAGLQPGGSGGCCLVA